MYNVKKNKMEPEILSTFSMLKSSGKLKRKLKINLYEIFNTIRGINTSQNIFRI